MPKWRMSRPGRNVTRYCFTPVPIETGEAADEAVAAGAASPPRAASRAVISSSTVGGNGPPSLAAATRPPRASADRSSSSISAGVDVISPPRIRSSNPSSLWVKPAMSVKPNVPLAPLMECAARNSRAINSSSSGVRSKPNSDSSITARCSAVSSKNTA